MNNISKKVLRDNIINISVASGINIKHISINAGLGENTLYTYCRYDNTISARLDTVDILANYLGLETWELLQPRTADEWRDRFI